MNVDLVQTGMGGRKFCENACVMNFDDDNWILFERRVCVQS